MNPMDLISILKNHTIYIQTHNFPDPDAIASAFGLQHFLLQHHIPSFLCYDGNIDRLNAQKMLNTFGITMFSSQELTQMTENDYIVLIDSQKMNGNVTAFIGKTVACIDHHPTFFEYDYLYRDIRPVGACSSIVASYFKDTNTQMSPECAAVLAYGIKMDTNDFIRGTTALDTLMLSFLFPHSDWTLVTQMYSNTMEFDDLRVYGAAIQNIQIMGRISFAYIPFDCSQSLIAIISDFILSLSVIDIAIIYAIQNDGIRFSIRCGQTPVHAGNLIASALGSLGSGGGHPSMAGGLIPAENVMLLGEDLHTAIQKMFLDAISHFP